MNLKTVIFFAVAVLFLTATKQTTAAEENTNEASGLARAFGGLLNRVATNPSSTNNAITLRSFETALENSLTNQSSSNVISLTNRLQSFLQPNTAGATNSTGATNVIAKLVDWLNTSQRSGTNVSTNTTTRRAWIALTNAIASHVTNSTNSSVAGGTNFVAKLRDWVANERQKSGNATNATSSSLALVENYLHSLTNSASTNSTFVLTNSIEQARSRFFDRSRTNNVGPRPQ